MCLCSLCTGRFLGRVHGTDVFHTYCRARRIPPPAPAAQPGGWAAALAALPAVRRGRVAAEVAALEELSDPEGVAHLMDAAALYGPPPPHVPDGGPVALWFLLHRPSLFWEVYFHHEHRDGGAWHVARATPELRVADADARADRLAGAVRTLFRRHDGTGRFSTARAYGLPAGTCFAVRVDGRPRVVDGFSPDGAPAGRPLPLAEGVQFVYYPQDGTVLLRAPTGSPALIRALLDAFSRAVLDGPVAPAAFALERLKAPFHPLPDALDMELVRVMALHLQYPARAGRRLVKVETRSSDGPGAIDDLLRAHAGDALAEARVTHAVLQVRLRVAGRAKTRLVRLWPDRCAVGPGPVGDRLLGCLHRWGLL